MSVTKTNTSEFVSSTEAAKILKASRFAVASLVSRGRLRGFQIARRWVLSRADVEELAKTYVPRVGRPRQKRKYTKRSARWFKK